MTSTKVFSTRQVDIGKNTKAIVSIPAWAEALMEGEHLHNEQIAFASVPLIFRCINLRCDTLTSCPIHVYKVSGDPDNRDEVEWPLPQDLNDLIWMTEAAMLLNGSAYWLKLSNGVGRLTDGVQWLNPFTVTVKLNPDTGMLMFTQDMATRNTGPWSSKEMVYFRDFNPSNDIGEGISATGVSLSSSGLMRYMTQFASVFFEKGAMPITILGIQGLSGKEEKERVEGFFKKIASGVKNAFRTIAVNTEQIDPKVLSQPVKDLAMPELSLEARRNIAWAFGIPVTMLEDASNYATAKEHRLSFWQDTVRPRGNKLARVINSQLLKPVFGMEMEFAFDELDIFQEDEEQRSDSYYNYVSAGMRPSIAAQILGIDLPEGIDYPMLDDKYDRQANEQDQTSLDGRPINDSNDTSNEKSIRDELRRWLRFELRRLSKGDKRVFKTTIIPLSMYGAISGALDNANDEASVKRIFDDAIRFGVYG